MHSILKTGFGAFVLLSSAAYAITNPRNNDIPVRIDEDILSAKYGTLNEKILASPKGVHTSEEFSVTLTVGDTRRSIRVPVSCSGYNFNTKLKTSSTK